ncbi:MULTISPECIES: hypothetical protein [Paenibacillus]|uniref:Amino acid transporter n=1 Tax=Paenibacillus albilobatus TaxID=2716884 RepID=A0A919XF86_9BACL|nr:MULTISPECIES: hypothetical protein [Paenibacillus]GIO31671.1 hypothetical protein J2TS6_28120 [Paenibacillus albilobatus]
MKQPNDEEKSETQEEIPSFNSVTDHYRNIMGVPTNKIDMKKMPRILRYFGYFVFSIFAVCTLLFIILYIVQFFR